MKKILFIFTTSFFLNLIWENVHSVLYIGYKGGQITELILLHATFVDAVIITLITLPFIFLPQFKKQSWLIIPLGIVVSVLIEYWGLGTGRWAYNSFMPVIPILQVGLTPTIQLGFIGFGSLKLVDLFLI